jgi:hypothetical protein
MSYDTQVGINLGNRQEAVLVNVNCLMAPEKTAASRHANRLVEAVVAETGSRYATSSPVIVSLADRKFTIYLPRP